MSENIETYEMVGAFPTCGNCGSTQVVRDAWAEWSMTSREWILKTVFDEFICERCGEANVPTWKLDEAFRTRRIARLNDAMRQGARGQATVVVTIGVQACGEAFVRKAAAAVMAFDDFTTDNDPHGEHDFGSIELEGRKLFWKIDPFDLKLERHSPDAANPALTHRVLTIMLASEY
ncbi:DUF3768 domain-containing protein [Marimonas sp. MJW-29]|uniref:DUF3768 domain-containing protein n=1 Tax=Sulfitobacter sediminis TaxID=3234186 RepID=A0ABV3RN29_9RHOB